MLHTSTRIEAKDPDAVKWWRGADGQDHAFRIIGSWMHSVCTNRVRWTAALTPALFGPPNACRDCETTVNGPEGEKRALDGNR